jgi:pimeloyl-ACP methyl ester carboxylesterase
MTTAFVGLVWGERRISIEHQWLSGPADSALMVFLHEGLGSVSMWRDFPAQLCTALGCRGLVYSRPGYGQSSPRPPQERWAPDFMHRQAHEVLPALLNALDARGPIWLVGHSDGGSIALLHAAQQGSARASAQGMTDGPSLAGLVVMAPHILVEEVSLRSIEQARLAYLQGGLREKLARHHADPDSAFWGWNQIWLDPAFAPWSIEGELSRITVPMLAIQGLNDEYGTLEQIRGIARRAPQTELLELPDCGHSPHRDQPQALIAGISRFFKRHSGLL